MKNMLWIIPSLGKIEAAAVATQKGTTSTSPTTGSSTLPLATNQLLPPASACVVAFQPMADGPSPPQDPPYSVAAIVASARTFGLPELERSAASVYKSACFRRALLWGGGVGTLVAAHRAKQGGTRFRIINDGLLAAAFTYGTQWYVCRVDEADRRAALRSHYLRQAPLARTDAPALANDSEDDSSAVGDEDWRRELERAVTYDLPRVERPSR